MVNALFVVSELDGLVKTGGLADVARHLPTELKKQGTNTVIALPHYQVLSSRLTELSKQPGFPAPRLVKDVELTLPSNDQHNHLSVRVKVHAFKLNEVDVLSFEINDFFARDGLYDTDYQAFADNGIRFGLFNFAVVQMFALYSEELNFLPTIIHCNDWQTGLVPLFAKRYLPHQCRTLITIHNGAFQGIFEHTQLTDLMPSILQAKQGLSHGEVDSNTQTVNEGSSQINFLTCALEYVDKIVAVSPNYATELLSPLGSHQLQESFVRFKDKLIGILNGCDYTDWDPSKDKYLIEHFSLQDRSNKLKNKQAIQNWAGLPIDKSIPLFVQVSRLTHQKGMDYLIPSLVDVLEHPIQVIIIGTGDPKYTEQLQELMLHHPTKLFFFNGFTEEINHRAIAGADFFLIPSLYEPCGLTQMHSLAFGTLPIARKVGGLVDSVIDINDVNGNGILFEQPEVASLSSAIRRAHLLYITNQRKLNDAQTHAMEIKFYWHRAANSYQSLYKQLLSI